MKEIANSPCLICGNTNFRQLFSTIYPAYNYPGEFIMNQCETCGFLFNSPRLSDPLISKLYDKNYYFFHRRDRSEFKRMEEMYRHTIALLETKIVTKKILEVGSAKGYFLALLKEIGWDVFGVEISKAAGQFSRKKLKVPTWTGQLETYIEQNEDKFPVVLAMDIIEHVTDPDYFLTCANKVLLRDGLLIIGTPNASSINIETQKQNWPGFNPFHIYLFKPENLAQLLQQNGFEIDFYFTYANQKISENETPDPLPSWRKTVKALLKKAGFIEFIKAIRLQCWQLLDASKRRSYLDAAVKNAQNAENYFDTEDGKSTYAKTAQGDNLIIVARKK